MNRPLDNLFPKGCPPPSQLRKLPLQWCMQECQVAVVIVVAKPSQNLCLNDTNCNRSEPRLALYQPGSGHCRQWLLENGGSLCSVSTEGSCPGLWFPESHSRWDCDRIQAGCLQERASSSSLTEPTQASLKSSLLFLSHGVCCAAGLELAAGSRYGAITMPEWGFKHPDSIENWARG